MGVLRPAVVRGSRRAARLLAVAVVALLGVVLVPQAFADPGTYVVTNTNDSGAGSLRQAILDANATPNATAVDQITFDLPAVSPAIAPATNLPAITDPVTIDGTTNTSGPVFLDGTSVGSLGVGLQIAIAPDPLVPSTVRGLTITNFAQAGLELGSGPVKAVGNFIGTNPSGASGLGNGIGLVASGAAVIGGPAPGERNVISGNHEAGISLSGAGATVFNNLIGTKPDGTTALGNGGAGISIDQENIESQSIGGTAAGQGNTIAFNTGAGVEVDGSGRGAVIQGNSIYSNGDLGIKLTNNANEAQPAPHLATVTVLPGGHIEVTGSDQTTGTPSIDVYASATCGSSGARYLGTYPAVSAGNFDTGTQLPGTATSGEAITTTLTDTSLLNTSEFSNCVSVPASLSGALTQPVNQDVDVTAAGTEDWAVWGDKVGTANLPLSALAPNQVKANGGRQISDLSQVNPSGTPPRGFDFAWPLTPFGFDWSDGTPTASETEDSVGITVPQLGEGFSFTVPADTTTRTLTIWTSAHYANGLLTAHLSDGSAPDYTQTLSAFAGQFPDQGENVPGVFTLQYAAASAGQHLTVTWEQTANNSCAGGCEDIVLYAAALAGGTAGQTTGATASLTSAQSVPSSGSNDAINTIPLRAFAPTQTGVTPAPINGLPINGLPINGLPINGLPINGLPINGLPINGLPINGLPINGLPINGLPINGLPINGLPINGLQIPGGWTAVLAGTPLAGKPLQTITLQQVLALNPQPAAVHNLTLGNLVVADSALGQVTIGALALGNTPINGLGAGGASIAAQLQAWCTHATGSAANCSTAAIGNQSLFALSLAGAPINGLPINGLPMNGLPINGLPINGLPINGLNLSASPINGLPINGLPINGLPINGLPAVTLATIVDCTKTGVDCASQTLGQAAAAGGIKSTATILDLLRILLADTSPVQSTLTVGDVIGLLIKSADVPWETLPPRLLSVFDTTRPTLHMSAGFTLQGTGLGGGLATVKVTLPDGFDYRPGTAQLQIGDGTASSIGEPTIDAQANTLTWDVPNVPFNTASSISFDTWSGSSVGAAQASETVTSGGFSGSGTVPFSVTDAFNNNSPATATAITADMNVEMSAIASAGEVDYYKVPMPAAGTRIRVHLTNLSADYDLALYSPTTTSVRTGATNGPPLQDGTIADQSLTLQGGGSNTQLTPTALQDVPDPGIPVVQVSANRGTDDEDVGMVSPGGGGYATIAVFGYNGASSPDPYTLRVTTQAPPGITCTPRALTGGTAGTVPTIASLPTNLNTLILVNEKRIGATYGAAAETSVVTSLNHLAGDASLGVSGAVIPVEGLAQTQYNAWDANPCDVNAANAVANTIANEIAAVKAQRPTLEYVVFAGGDDQIPFFRIPDLSLIANETGFAGQFNNNEYYGALASGDLLTDNPYLDTRPVPASGRQIFIPDLAGGRLVETPAQITSAVTSFESSNGTLRNSTAFVSGYDFVSDGSQLVAQRLQSILGASSVRSLIDTTTPFVPATSWSKNGLLNAAFPTLGQAAINDWNGHYDNTRALMANGDLLSASELTGTHAFSGGIFLTMGCHAGFQTTDAIIGTPVADWAQYFAGTGTGFVGNTGFGLGNTDSVAFSEELMANFAGHLDRTVSIGQALNLAKEDYFLSRDAFSSYDEKTLSEAELYGLPMYGVGAPPAPLGAPAPAPVPLPDPVSGTASSTSPSTGLLAPFAGNSVQAAGFAVTPTFSGPVNGQHGSYYTNAGQVQAPNYRPLQPYVTLPASRTDLAAHGVVIDTLASDDQTGFNPDNVRPTVDLTANEAEPQFTDQAWPTKVPTLVSLDDPNGLQQRLNLTTGQFFTSTDGGTRTERLWTQIGGRVTYSSSTDFVPPTVDQIDAYLTGSTVTFSGHFSDRTETGAAGTVVFAQVVYDVNNTGTWKSIQLVQDATGAWSGGAPFTGTRVQFFAEVCDTAGNCGYSSNKGRYFDAAPLPTTTGSITLTPSGTAGAGGWYTSNVNVTGTSSTPGVTITVSVDGGQYAPIPNTGITLTGDGAHTLSALGSDGSKATAVVLIDKTPPTVAFAPGTVAYGAHVPAFTCLDSGSGATTCTGTQHGTPANGGDPLDTSNVGTVHLAATATDVVGNRVTAEQDVQVVKATPTVAWPAPAPISYGTKLSAIQLDATASANGAPLPGTFAYSPAAGTVLQPGSQTLSVTFTPTDAVHYTTATGTTTISVVFTQACITTSKTGPFNVASGQSVCVSSGGKLTGPVTVRAGGALWINGGVVTGPFSATGAARLAVCGSTFTGPVTVTAATGYVQFGGTGCTGNKITGPVSITKGSGGLSFVGNKVTGPLTITNNKGGFTYSGNTVTGPVTVSGNS